MHGPPDEPENVNTRCATVTSATCSFAMWKSHEFRCVGLGCCNRCCTEPCEVLGVGIPLWAPLDPNNPVYGGLKVQHMGVPPPYVHSRVKLLLPGVGYPAFAV